MQGHGHSDTCDAPPVSAHQVEATLRKPLPSYVLHFHLNLELLSLPPESNGPADPCHAWWCGLQVPCQIPSGNICADHAPLHGWPGHSSLRATPWLRRWPPALRALTPKASAMLRTCPGRPGRQRRCHNAGHPVEAWSARLLRTCQAWSSEAEAQRCHWPL